MKPIPVILALGLQAEAWAQPAEQAAADTIVAEHELGSVEGFQEKLDRLRIFYREGLEQVGWNKYSTISLAYDGQVVCTKANGKK